MSIPIRFVALVALVMGTAQGAVVHNEAIDGDFSGSHLDPTRIDFAVGQNLVIAGVGGNPFDRDIFTATVPVGASLSAIRILNFEGSGGPSFMGMQPGSRLSHSPHDWIQADMGAFIPDLQPINYVLFGSLDADQDRDVMPQLVVGAPLGGESPLPAGEYAFWLNETRATSRFTLDFVVVPEPSVGVLIMAGGTVFLGRRVRKTRS